MKATLLFIFICITFSSTKAQTAVTGFIYDSDGSVLKAASVRLFHFPDSTLVFQTTTLDDGSYQLTIEKNKTYIIQYSSVGYKSFWSDQIRSKESKLQLADVKLESSEEIIDMVNVVGRQPGIRQYADKMVIDVGGTVLAEGNNVLELLEKTPGVVSDGKGNFSIQGRAGANVRIDGRNMYVSGEQLAIILRGLQASEVSKLELMSNPSAREDASGTAGIINIVTKRNARSGFSGDVSSQAILGRKLSGSFAGGLHYKVNGWDMYVQGNKSYSRTNSHNLTERSFFENADLKSFQRQLEQKSLDDATSHSVRAGLKYEFVSGGILDASVHWMEGRYKPIANIDMESWNYPNKEAINRSLSNNAFDESYKNWTFNVNYVNKYDGEDHFLKMNFDFAPHGNDYDNRFETQFLNANGDQGDKTGRINVQDLSNTTYAGRLDYSKPFGEANKIELGWKGTYFFINNDVQNSILKQENWIKDEATSNRFQYTQHIEALYAIYSGKSNRLEYQAGLRAEYTFINANQLTLAKRNKQQYLDFFPSGSLLYQLNDQHNLRTSFSSRIERPGDHDINVFRIYEDAFSYFEGNPDLKPEKSYITEVGHGYKNKVFTTFGLSYGENIIKWIIGQGDKIGENLSKPENIGSYMNYSLSMMYNQTIASFWTANHYINVFHNRYSGEIRDVQLDAKGSSWVANSRHTLQFKYGLRGEVAMYYRSGITEGPTRTDARYGIDLAAEKKLFGERGMIKFAANGLLQNNNPGLISEYGDLKIRYSDFPDTRKFVLSLHYRFGN